MDTQIEKPKYQLVLDVLIGRIANGELKPGDCLPSLSRIIGQYGVSKITAQRVLRELKLNGYVDIAPGNGAFVRARPGFATAVQSGEIAVVLGGAREKHVAALMRGLKPRDGRTRLHVYLSGGDARKELEVLERVEEWGIGRVVLSPVLSEEGHAVNAAALEALAGAGRRLVVLGSAAAAGRNVARVWWDDRKAFGQITQMLSASGARRLVFVSDAKKAGAARARLEGFEKGAHKSGVDAWREHIVDLETGSSQTRGKWMREAIAELLSRDHAIDGLVCANTAIANAALGVVRAMGGRRNPRLGGTGHPGALADADGVEYLMAEHDAEALGRAAGGLLESDGEEAVSLAPKVRAVRVMGL